MKRTLSLFAFLLCLGFVNAQVTLDVIGFRVPPNEIGTPLDEAYKTFIADFEAANPGVKINALETPPDFDTYVLTALATGTAPAVWSQDGSSLAKISASGQLLDMQRCVEEVPDFDLNRFFPNVLDLHKISGGEALYGVPNDFTPMVIYYNPESFERAGVQIPEEKNLTREAFIELAQRLTLDSEGRNALDPDFDAANVEQYGFRVRQYPFEWVYDLWANGGDVISPDGTTASGYLDSEASLEAINFLRDLVLEYGVSPNPSALDALQVNLGAADLFLQGKIAMYKSGHWEMVGLKSNADYAPGKVAVMGNSYATEPSTVIYESGFVIPASLSGEELSAACRFVEAATNSGYQETKALTGIAISGNASVAESSIATAESPDIEQAFFDQIEFARPPYGSRYSQYPAVETVLESMMERILNGDDVSAAVADAVQEINRELSR